MLEPASNPPGSCIATCLPCIAALKVSGGFSGREAASLHRLAI
jgi:hypothetical protein